MGIRAAFLVSVLAFCLVLPVLAQPAADSAGWRSSGLTPKLLERAAFPAIYDDGEADTYYSAPVSTLELAMLFDNVGGEDVTFGSVDVCWRSVAGDTKIRYEVVLWDTDGVGGAPGTELAKWAAVAESVSLSPTFFTTTLNYPLTQQDVYVGVRFHPIVDQTIALCVDRDGIGGVQPAFGRGDELGAWLDMELAFGDTDYNALMIRGFLSTPGVFVESLLVPTFEVDTTDPGGTSTLIAVRNLTDDEISVDLDYYQVDGAAQAHSTVILGGRDTTTVNIRDVPGLSVDMDGFARGFVEMTTVGAFGETMIAGDYFLIDVDGNFATGEQAVRYTDGVCSRQSVRFLDFGSPTDLVAWIENPRGGSELMDPASFTVQVIDEDGAPDGDPQPVWTDDHVVAIDVGAFTTLGFGTVVFDFTDAGGGTLYAEYGAFGLFSVGVGPECEED